MRQLELDFGTCALCTYDEDGFLQIQVDAMGLDGKAGTHGAAALLPYGLVARPLDPEQGTSNDVGLGVQVLRIRAGDAEFAIPFSDPRDVAKIPPLRKGSVALVGGAGDYRSFLLIDGLDPTGATPSGSIYQMAAYGGAGAKKALAITMDVRTVGQEAITIVHGKGQRFSMTANGAMTMVNAHGTAWIETNAKGNVLAGATKVQGSLKVGEGTAEPVALATAIIAAIEILSKTVIAVAAAAAGAIGAQGAPAAALPLAQISALTQKMKALHLYTT